MNFSPLEVNNQVHQYEALLKDPLFKDDEQIILRVQIGKRLNQNPDMEKVWKGIDEKLDSPTSGLDFFDWVVFAVEEAQRPLTVHAKSKRASKFNELIRTSKKLSHLIHELDLNFRTYDRSHFVQAPNGVKIQEVLALLGERAELNVAVLPLISRQKSTSRLVIFQLLLAAHYLAHNIGPNHEHIASTTNTVADILYPNDAPTPISADHVRKNTQKLTEAIAQKLINSRLAP